MTFECATNLTGYTLIFSYSGSIAVTVKQTNIATMNGPGTAIWKSNTTIFNTGNVYKYFNNTIHIHLIILEINIVKYCLFFIDLLIDNFVSFNTTDA